MSYLINAWLERSRPCLQVIHRESGRVCVDFSGIEIENLCRREGLAAEDFTCSCAETMKETVRQLFRAAARRDCATLGSHGVPAGIS